MPGRVLDGPVDETDAPLGTADARPGTPDAKPGAPDAKPGAPDAKPALDARPMFDGLPGDAAVACTANGIPGTCIDTTLCANSGGTSTPHLCPGPTNIQCCTHANNNSLSCDTDMSTQPNADLSEEPGAGGCPAGMLRIEDPDHSFCIDRFEAALDLDNGDSMTPWSPYFNPGANRVVARSLRDAVPQGYITGDQAKQACAAAGKRLCLDTEWLRACRGPDGLTFPYGNTRETGVCNDQRAEHPAVELFGSVTNLSSPCINQLHDTVDRTGARTGCVTAEGAFDMMGNLHEWTADPNGTFRGGFYVDTVINGPGCLYTTTAHDTAYSDYSTGFRCCAD